MYSAFYSTSIAFCIAYDHAEKGAFSNAATVRRLSLLFKMNGAIESQCNSFHAASWLDYR
jgi:hypothetical protein